MSLLRRSQRVSFPSGWGSTLSGIVDQPHDEPKAFVVFTHCFTCTKDLKLIVRISRGLAELGFGVLRYDSTGLGGSSGDFSNSNFTSNQTDLLAAVQFMSQHYRAPEALIGHSFGGAASLSIAAQVPSVQAVVSIAAPSDTLHLASLLEGMNPSILSTGRGSVSIGGTLHTISRQMLENFRAFDLSAHVRQLSVPVLLFHSPEDETLGFQHALRLYHLLTDRRPEEPPACAASLVCLPGADHLLLNQAADLILVTRVIAAWLDRYVGNSALS
jgi:dipeptidyl aminopeptidase/acylaminoacyl peptidase